MACVRTVGIAQCTARNTRKLELPADFYPQRLRQPAAVCAEPADKAAFLGFELLTHALGAAGGGTEAAELVRGVYTANPSVLEGFLAALEALDAPGDRQDAERVCSALDVVSPVALTALTNSKGTRARAAWGGGEVALLT